MTDKRLDRRKKVAVFLLVAILAPVACAADPDTQLLDGIRTKSVDEIRSAIDRGADVNRLVAIGSSSSGATSYAPIISFAILNHVPVSILQILHDAGAKIDTPDLKGRSPLFYAVTTRPDVASWHLVHGDDSQYPTTSADAAEWLLSTAADPLALAGQRDDHGSTVLHSAVIECDQVLVDRVLDLGVNVSIRDDDGLTPLMEAALYGCAEAVNALLDSGAQLSPRDLVGRDAIVHAARRGDIAVLRALVLAGGSATSIDQSGASALMYAARAGSQQVIEYLLSLDADPQRRDSHGRTALMWACMEPEMIGAPPGLILGGGYSDETTSQRSEVVLALIEAGADVDVKDTFRKTAFDYAQGSGVLEGTEAFWQLSDARF